MLDKMTNQEIIDDIQKAHNLTEHYQFIDTLIDTDHERLISFFDLIPKDWNYLLYNSRLRSCYQRIIDLVSINKNNAFISVASALFNKIERQSDKLKIASMLSSIHHCEDLLDELILLKNDELLSLVMHEVVSRGIDLRPNKHYDYLVSVNDLSEFRVLSLYPLEQEMENTFPSYQRHNNGVMVSCGFSYGFSYEDEYQSIKGIKVKHMVVEEDQEIVEVMRHWGMSIAYKGNTSDYVSIQAIIKGISSFSNSKKIRIKSINTVEVFKKMFDASSKGVAYGNGNFGAYGRLKAWKSIHKLMEGQGMQSNLITSEKMKEFEWVEFNTDDWFINEIFDLGLICYHANTFAFGLIAGTDTD